MVDAQTIRNDLNRLPVSFHYTINPADAEYASWVAQEHSALVGAVIAGFIFLVAVIA